MKEIIVCPKCGTKPSTFDFKQFQRGSTYSTFTCKNCGYSGLPIKFDNEIELKKAKFFK